MQNCFFISEPALYAPGLETTEDFKLWAENKKEILFEKSSPSLSYTDALFRRRLSQLSKMTVEVVHNLIEKIKTGADKAAADDITKTKIVFTSFRGEIEREFKINQSIIEDEMILPAGFSLSVFNAPVALATMACNLKSGYNTVFPTGEDFASALLCAASPILAGKQKQVIFVYADELIPEVYSDFAPKDKPPLAFAVVLSSEPLKGESGVKSVSYTPDSVSKDVYEFIRLHVKKCYN
ncbi:beta-ketoacyl synthase chain length factor [Treponema sp.]|uniref:beta-ketoacyl synthase chain length factor n=1 Tax=Treponema sp. TaxID=166 RepID=UPI00298D76C4|nr:beta-ketoacyl synthase chain length factor [Treponema sp.]MCR5613022.1 beta-ketoacyl synthase chain length factor [Treponema sp.]